MGDSQSSRASAFLRDWNADRREAGDAFVRHVEMPRTATQSGARNACVRPVWPSYSLVPLNKLVFFYNFLLKLVCTFHYLLSHVLLQTLRCVGCPRSSRSHTRVGSSRSACQAPHLPVLPQRLPRRHPIQTRQLKLWRAAARWRTRSRHRLSARASRLQRKARAASPAPQVSQSTRPKSGWRFSAAASSVKKLSRAVCFVALNSFAVILLH